MLWIKRALLGLTILIVLLAAGLAWVAFGMDADRFKAPLQQWVQRTYQRQLLIEGPLHFTLLPRLGVDVGRLSLSEPDSPQAFLSLNSAHAAVELLPLLSGRAVVDRIRIDGLKANLYRNRAGQFNFQDLLTSKAGGAPISIDIDGIKVRQGEVALRDETLGIVGRLTQLDIDTGHVAERQPFALKVAARLLTQQPRVDVSLAWQATVTFDSTAQRYRLVQTDLKANGQIPQLRATDLSVQGSFDLDLPNGSVAATEAKVAFQGDLFGDHPVSGIDAKLSAPAFAIRLADSRLHVDELVATVKGRQGGTAFSAGLEAPRLQISNDSASGERISLKLQTSGAQAIAARIELQGVHGRARQLVAVQQMQVDATLKQPASAGQAARELMLHLKTPLTFNWPAQLIHLPAVTAQLAINDARLPEVLRNIPLQAESRLDFKKAQLWVKAAAVVDQSNLGMQLDVQNFDKPRINVALNAERIDLDRWFPAAAAPAASASPGGTPNNTTIDLKPLHGLNATGAIRIGQFRSRGLQLSNLSANVRIDQGRAEINNIAANVYGGQLNGSIFADANTQIVGVKPVFTQVQMLPLLQALAKKDTFEGRANLNLALTGRGTTVDQMLKSLSGQGALQIRDGALRGINLAKSFRDAKARLTLREDQQQRASSIEKTDFSELSIAFDMQAGIAQLRDLNFKAPALRATLGTPAWVDLTSRRLDIVTRAVLVNTATGQDGKALDQLRDITLPIRLAGPLDAPSYSILWSSVSSDILKRKVKQIINEKVNDKVLPPEKQQALKQNLKDKLNQHGVGNTLQESLKGFLKKGASNTQQN